MSFIDKYKCISRNVELLFYVYNIPSNKWYIFPIKQRSESDCKSDLCATVGMAPANFATSVIESVGNCVAFSTLGHHSEMSLIELIVIITP